jgi:formylglycine-generating enzyme required for sulfatase activity
MNLVRRLALVVLLIAAAPVTAADPTMPLDLGGGVKLELVLIKAGEFKQGSPPTEAGRLDDEKLHPVKITRDFYAGKYPVTHAQFERFIKETGYKTEAEQGISGGFGWDGKELVQKKEYTWRSPGFKQTGEHPVVLVTHGDAVAFTRWLSRKAKVTVQLPTEAQWEYLCRAGTTTRFPGGNKDDDGLADAWCKENAGDGTRPVGQKKANAWGLYDTCGNVHEWCRDWYGPYPDGPQTDPEQTNEKVSDKPRRVMRGGSWLRELHNCRSAARSRNTPGSRNADNGFRIIAYADKPDPKVGDEFGELKDPDATSQSDTNTQHKEDKGSVMGGICASLFTCGCPATLGVVALVVIVMIVRKASRAATGRAAPDDGWGSVRPTGRGRATATGGGGGGAPVGGGVRLADDGFWLEGSEFPPNAVVRYRCVVGGEAKVDRIVIEPGPRGTFVYTGGRPERVEILEVVQQGASQTFGVPYDETTGYGPTTTRSRGTSPSIPPPIPPTPPHRRPDDQTFGYPSAY